MQLHLDTDHHAVMNSVVNSMEKKVSNHDAEETIWGYLQTTSSTYPTNRHAQTPSTRSRPVVLNFLLLRP